MAAVIRESKPVLPAPCHPPGAGNSFIQMSNLYF